MPFPRFTKQLLIAFIFFSVVAGVSFWIWHITRPQPTCFDGIKNQDEQGVDCGGVCALACVKEPVYKSATVSNVQSFKIDEGVYDVLGEIENQNGDFGFSSLSYEFTLLDQAANPIASRRGEAYLLPKEKRYVVEQRLQTATAAASVVLKTFDEEWLEINEYTGANFAVRNQELTVMFDGGKAAGTRFAGTVLNRTGFDFGEAQVVVVLKNKDHKEVAVGVTEMKVLRDRDERAFEFRWPQVLDISDLKSVVSVYTNVLRNENFLARYGKDRERFQEEVPAPSQDNSPLRGF